MKQTKILVVEDEEAIRDLIVFGLKRAGFEVRTAGDVHGARIEVADWRPDLLLVDWMLPDTSGLEFTRELKRDDATRELPVIMLTARSGELDKVQGLEGGADDYVTKPFSARELIARIGAVLRRAQPGDAEGRVEFQGLVLEQAAHRALAGGEPLALGPTEYKLLAHFMTHADRVFSRAQLLDRVWGAQAEVSERAVDVHIRRLRQALEASGHDALVQTVRGVGYRFSAGSA